MEYKNAPLLQREELANGIFRLVLQAEPGVAAMPGQFVQIRTPARNTILPRPISVSDYDRESGCLTLVIQQKGPGTAALCSLSQGNNVDILWPLGNGLLLGPEQKNVWLFGAGLGLAPMLYAARVFKSEGKKVTAFCGFRNAGAAYYLEEMKPFCDEIIVATDDGSLGQKAFLHEAVCERLRSLDSRR
ncbi:MAG: hypothetical protein FWD16_05295, partial [Clostridia bacterium]|nr:hypothetical protein [Clostridia bacterium]